MPNASIPAIQQFQMPDVANSAAKFMQLKILRDQAQNIALEQQRGAQEQQREVQERQKATKRKIDIEVKDFALNTLAGVNSAEDLEIAREQFNARYPQYAGTTNKIMSDYTPDKVRMIRNSLRTETQRMKAEEEQETQRWKKEGEITAYGAGSALYRGGEAMGQVPFAPSKPPAPQFEVFQNESGNQAYMKKGDEIPEGWKKVKGGAGVTINMPRAAPSGEREKLNKLYDFKSQLTRIREEFDPKFTGRIQGAIGVVKEATGVGVEKKQVMFQQVVRDIADTLLRLRSGAQINEQEYKRLTKLVPTATLPDETFLARLDSLTKAIDSSIKTRRRTLEESGFAVPTGEQDIVIRYDAQGNRISP